MNSPVLYFENFSFVSFLSGLFKYKLLINLSSEKYKTIYFIDASLFAQRFLLPLLKFLGLTVEKLQFIMLDIVDSNGELVRLRIPREDLFSFQEKILDSEAYKALYHRTWNQNSIADFVNKGLIDEDVMNADSVSRVLFIINVVFWHMQKLDYKQAVFVINNRAWTNLYKEYAESYKIELLSMRSILFKFSDLKKIIRNYRRLYKIAKNIKHISINNKNNIENITKNKLFLDGRGDINLSNDGLHSDFFWQLNSKFPLQNILLKHHSEEEKQYLSQQGVYSIAEGIYSNRKHTPKYIKPKSNYSYHFREEFKVVKSILNLYDLERYYSASLFKQQGAKILFTWQKYSNSHIALLDSIRDNEGISAIWQIAFDGYKNSDCAVYSDIVFNFSKFSLEMEKKLQSKIKYSVIVGYPKDYAAPLLKDRADKLREKLKANGAKKIVFAIDENSVDDSRWHTGHEMQRENYSYILEKVLEISWLGVIFKPKAAKTLRKRLGPIANLLEKAEATGRCYIYEDSVKGRYSTIAPPILAGLSADVCVHGHLASGTAALECALEGIPTLLIDREGTIDSKLNELPKGKVVFKDWPSTIDSILEHFNTPEGTPGFGDWSSIIDDLDPYRDGMAANRIGTYLSWLLQGYDQGLDKETIMFNAAERYKEQWGEDKVICA